MARNAPVPFYTTTTQLNGTTKRKLSTVSPGTTDSTATKGPSATLLAPQSYYLSPEATATAGTLNAVGAASGRGWGLVPSDNAAVVPLAADGFTLAAGTLTWPVVAARDSGLTSADQTAAFTVIVFRANANATTFPQELGRATLSAQTITTTKTAFNVNVALATAVFAPGEILWVEVFAATTTTSALGSIASFYTNSTTAMRVTAAPVFTIQHQKSLADSAPIADAIGRSATYARQLADSAPATDELTKAATFRRSLSDATPPPTDSLLRLYIANRILTDSAPVSDAIRRLAQYNRRLSDSALVADNLQRKATYARQLADNLTSGGGTVIIAPVFGVFD